MVVLSCFSYSEFLKIRKKRTKIASLVILGTLVDSSDQEPDEDHEVDHNDIEH